MTNQEQMAATIRKLERQMKLTGPTTTSLRALGQAQAQLREKGATR